MEQIRPHGIRRQGTLPLGAGFMGGDPQRYSRFVVIMKRVLLFSALALIAAVLAYSLQPRESGRMAMNFAHLDHIAGDLAMIKPKLHGTDADGDPFLITADRAVQDGPSAHKAKLYNVQADITLKKGPWITATARQGYLNVDKNTLVLSGGLSLYTDTGYELHTDHALLNLMNGQVESDVAVSGHGPGGALRADRFRVEGSGKLVQLSGHVQMQFFVHGAKS